MKNLYILLMVFALLFSCKKSDEEKLSGKVSKKTEVITTNTEKEISKQTADFDKDKFYERSFLLDWNFGRLIGEKGETGVRIHQYGKGNIHGYPVNPDQYLK